MNQYYIQFQIVGNMRNLKVYEAYINMYPDKTTGQTMTKLLKEALAAHKLEHIDTNKVYIDLLTKLN